MATCPRQIVTAEQVDLRSRGDCLRAIEQGLPLVRAANTGISAVIDPVGRTVASLGLGLEGVLDSPLPSALPPTLYARAGDIPAILMIAVAWLIVIRRRAVK